MELLGSEEVAQQLKEAIASELVGRQLVLSQEICDEISAYVFRVFRENAVHNVSPTPENVGALASECRVVVRRFLDNRQWGVSGRA